VLTSSALATVDLFHATSGTWNTAALSVARYFLAATSLPNYGLAMFAGGVSASGSFSNTVDIFDATSGTWSTAALSVARCYLAATSLPNQGLAIFAGGSSSVNTVDIFDATSGTWSTAALSVARCYLAATSLPNQGLAIFAGGSSSVNTVDIFNATSGTWSTAALSVARSGLAATSLANDGLAIFAGGTQDTSGGSGLNTVDIFNATSGTWSTAALSVARYWLAATSLPNYGLTIFAGGCDASNIYNTVDIMTVCPSGFHSIIGSCLCSPCAPGSFNPFVGQTQCAMCPAGSFCGPDSGNAMPTPCAPGSFNPFVGQTQCAMCPAGSFCGPDSGNAMPTNCSAGTYNPVMQASSVSSCLRCPAGAYCLAGASQQCRCPINSYAPPSGGASACTPCLGQAVPKTGQSECVAEVAVTGSEKTLFKSIIGVFAVISLGSVCLVAILVRSRHAFSVRPFHSGICIYIASFAPYALLKAVATVKLLEAKTQGEQLTAGLMLNGTFMMFFWLGFGGKMALIQLWMHLISRHTSGDSEHALMESARRTWRFMRLTVLLVCVLYGVGFISLVGVYAQASSACAAAAKSTICILFTESATPPACQRVVALAQGIIYYEGAFAAVVVVLFTFYALLFNGLVYAMLTSDATFSNLTKLQRLLISNTFLRCMLRPYARARRRFRCDIVCSSRQASGSFHHRGSRPPTRRRATLSYGARRCAGSGSSSPSSVFAASDARPCWWRWSSMALCPTAAACTSACRRCLWRRCPRCSRSLCLFGTTAAA